jgi:Glycolipid 2-alpha-mannosyltransferase
MSGITGAFTLARALNMAFLIDWSYFIDCDDRDSKQLVSIPLNAIFHLPCFQWDLSRVNYRIIDYQASRYIDLTSNDTDADYDSIINGNITSWQQHRVISVKAFHDFTPLLLLNPAFDAVARSFPRNTYASAREPQIPSPSTLTVRYLFTPNIKTYGSNITTEFQRLKDEVRQNCAGSRFYGLHLRLRSEFASKENVFFPCLEKLSSFTGDKCYFIASDSDKTTATVKPHLPPSARLLFLNVARDRSSSQGLKAAIVELYILGSSSKVFGFTYSTFTSLAATIQGMPMSEQHCYLKESPFSNALCSIPKSLRKAVVKVIKNVTDNAFDQRKRLGCVLLDIYPPNDPERAINYELKKPPVVSACIVYVLTDAANIDSLLVSIKSLEVNLFATVRQTYRIIIFTQNIAEEQLKPLLNVRERMDVAVVDLGPLILPLSLRMDSLKGKDDASVTRFHMNRFLSGPIFKHPELKGYDYIMRLDAASSLCSPVAADPFQLMVSRGLNYASARQLVADDLPMTGLDGLTKSFLHDKGIRPVNIHHSLSTTGQLKPFRYSDSYEVIRLEFFVHSKYYDYFEVLDKALGFYTQGWDEGVIKHIGLTILTSQNSVGDLNEIVKYYKHCPK